MAKKKSPKKLIQNPEIIDSQIDDEIVMMDVDKGAYFGLDPVASFIWEKLKEPNDIDGLVTLLMDEYDVGKEQCRDEVEQFLEQMKKANLLVEVD